MAREAGGRPLHIPLGCVPPDSIFALSSVHLARLRPLAGSWCLFLIARSQNVASQYLKATTQSRWVRDPVGSVVDVPRCGGVPCRGPSPARLQHDRPVAANGDAGRACPGAGTLGASPHGRGMQEESWCSGGHRRLGTALSGLVVQGPPTCAGSFEGAGSNDGNFWVKSSGGMTRFKKSTCNMGKDSWGSNLEAAGREVHPPS